MNEVGCVSLWEEILTKAVDRTLPGSRGLMVAPPGLLGGLTHSWAGSRTIQFSAPGHLHNSLGMENNPDPSLLE